MESLMQESLMPQYELYMFDDDSLTFTLLAIAFNWILLKWLKWYYQWMTLAFLSHCNYSLVMYSLNCVLCLFVHHVYFVAHDEYLFLMESIFFLWRVFFSRGEHFFFSWRVFVSYDEYFVANDEYSFLMASICFSFVFCCTWRAFCLHMTSICFS